MAAVVIVNTRNPVLLWLIALAFVALELIGLLAWKLFGRRQR